MKDYLKRPQDVMKAVRLLRCSGLSVSLPYQTANQQMCFEVEDWILTAAQILELLDKNNLDPEGIRRSGAKRSKDAG